MVFVISISLNAICRVIVAKLEKTHLVSPVKLSPHCEESLRSLAHPSTSSSHSLPFLSVYWAAFNLFCLSLSTSYMKS